MLIDWCDSDVSGCFGKLRTQIESRFYPATLSHPRSRTSVSACVVLLSRLDALTPKRTPKRSRTSRDLSISELSPRIKTVLSRRPFHRPALIRPRSVGSPPSASAHRALDRAAASAGRVLARIHPGDPLESRLSKYALVRARNFRVLVKKVRPEGTYGFLGQPPNQIFGRSVRKSLTQVDVEFEVY